MFDEMQKIVHESFKNVKSTIRVWREIFQCKKKTINKDSQRNF